MNEKLFCYTCMLGRDHKNMLSLSHLNCISSDQICVYCSGNIQIDIPN